jgi:hypothetical protein
MSFSYISDCNKGYFLSFCFCVCDILALLPLHHCQLDILLLVLEEIFLKKNEETEEIEREIEEKEKSARKKSQEQVFTLCGFIGGVFLP